MARWTASCVIAALLAALGVLGLMLGTGARSVPVGLGDWVAIPAEHFHFRLKFVFDRLSVPFALLTLVLAQRDGVTLSVDDVAAVLDAAAAESTPAAERLLALRRNGAGRVSRAPSARDRERRAVSAARRGGGAGSAGPGR